MQFEITDHGEARVISVLDERIDAAVAIQFKDAMRQAVGEKATRIVLDLTPVSFLDSSGLGALVAAMKFLGHDRKLELACLQQNVMRVFTLTRMDTVFTIYASLADAVELPPAAQAG